MLNLLDSDDIRYMVDALKTLGLEITEDRANNVLEITGCAGRSGRGRRLFPSQCGYRHRPLAAVAAAGKGTFVLDGVERMRERLFRTSLTASSSSASTPSALWHRLSP